jgi:hypothetical protein
MSGLLFLTLQEAFSQSMVPKAFSLVDYSPKLVAQNHQIASPTLQPTLHLQRRLHSKKE